MVCPGITGLANRALCEGGEEVNEGGRKGGGRGSEGGREEGEGVNEGRRKGGEGRRGSE